jgi:uncharacterized protein
MLDVRKAAVRGLRISGVINPFDLQRFRSVLAENHGLISVDLSFDRDEENRYLIEVSVRAEFVVTCQRCLDPLPEQVSCKNTLAIVWTDEQAAHLPRHLEPLIVDEQSCNLWDLVEEELILATPQFSYHDNEDCKKRIEAFSDPVSVDDTGDGRPNPFNVLRQLKPGEKH